MEDQLSKIDKFLESKGIDPRYLVTIERPDIILEGIGQSIEIRQLLNLYYYSELKEVFVFNKNGEIVRKTDK